MSIILLSRDLIFISRVKEAVAAGSQNVTVVKVEGTLFEALQASSGGFVLIDLERCPLSIEVVSRAMASLDRTAWRCISFYSHVHLEKAAQAKELGLGEVVPRSKFVQLLPSLCV